MVCLISYVKLISSAATAHGVFTEINMDGTNLRRSNSYSLWQERQSKKPSLSRWGVFTWQPSPRIITRSHDLVVGGAPEPSLWLVEAWNEVMFNQQTKRECHYDTQVTDAAWSELYSNFSQASKGKVLEWCHSGLKLKWKQWPGKTDFLRLYIRRMRCSKTIRSDNTHRSIRQIKEKQFNLAWLKQSHHLLENQKGLKGFLPHL